MLRIPRLDNRQLATVGVCVIVGLQIKLLRKLSKTVEALEELESMMFFNLQREFQKQVDEEFVEIVENLDDSDGS